MYSQIINNANLPYRNILGLDDYTLPCYWKRIKSEFFFFKLVYHKNEIKKKKIKCLICPHPTLIPLFHVGQN